MLKIVRRVLRLSGDLKGRIYTSFICSFIDSMLATLPIAAVFCALLELKDSGAISGDTWSVVIVLAVGGLLGRMLFKYIIYRLQSTAGFEFVARERLALGDKLKRVPMGFFHEHNLGDVTATVTTDLNFLENYSMHILDRVSTGILNMLVIGVFIFIFDWRLGLIFALGVLCSFPVYNHMQKRGAQLSNERARVQSESIQSTLEYVQGIGVIKAFRAGETRLRDIERVYEENAASAYKIERVFAPLNMSWSLTFRATACLLMFAAAVLVMGGNLTFAEFSVVLIASFTIFSPVEVLGQLTSMMRMMDASLDRVDAIKSERDLDEGGQDITPERFDVEFEHVNFSYGSGGQILQDMSFTVPERSMTAIVGPSGSGKTTITRLVARFWDVQGGSVKIGGRDVREFTSDCLLRNISIVFQNVYLFNDTVENNIKFGVPNASREEVVAAAKRARCHDFIERLPDGYDTVIGEGGSTLSGGENQRISIARAMLKDAPIILLDEATASVDAENELYLQQAISELVRDKTLIVIAHRLSTIRDADQILVVDCGSIVQRGTHEELVNVPGIYRNFWNVRTGARRWRVGR